MRTAMRSQTAAELPEVARFRAMYDASLPSIYGFIRYRIGGDRALAEDLTAETFASAVEEYRAGRPEVVTVSWLRTVAKRRVIDHWRRRSVSSAGIVKLVASGAAAEAPDYGEREVVVRALASLSEDARAALVLRHVEGYPVGDVADVLGRTEKATESLLGRAREAFRAAYLEVTDD